MKKGEIVIHPIITEKSTEQQENGKYSFKVNKRA
ncbi:MAG: 50S ribosomal protein L23, partial [Spirochaetes bacterium]|nr:50S ribosomal protein L23 [Spirochaetota bacterium]